MIFLLNYSYNGKKTKNPGQKKLSNIFKKPPHPKLIINKTANIKIT